MPSLPGTSDPQPDVSYAVAAATVSTLVVLASFLLLCAKKGGSSNRIAELEKQVSVLETENAALRQNADATLQSEIAELKRTTALLLKAAPQPPASVKHFKSEYFRPAWFV